MRTASEGHQLLESASVASQLGHLYPSSIPEELLVCALASPNRPSAELLRFGAITEVNSHRLIGAIHPVPYGILLRGVAAHSRDRWPNWLIRVVAQAVECASDYGHAEAGSEHLLEVVFRESEGLLPMWAQRMGLGERSLVYEELLEARRSTGRLLAHTSYPHFYEGEALQDDAEVWARNGAGHAANDPGLLDSIIFWGVMNDWKKKR